MHNNKFVNDGEKKKTQITLYYNRTKRDVDTMDQMVRNYSCKRMTRRWPTVLWHNMLDIVTINVFTIFKALKPNYLRRVTHERWLFIRELTKQLVVPSMRKRHATPSLQKPNKEAMMKCGLTFQNADVVQQQTLLQNGKDVTFVRVQNIEKFDATAHSVIRQSALNMASLL